MNKEELQIAQENFWIRKDANAGVEQVNNAHAPAGAPMVYYCRHCGDHTATLPECHAGPAPTVCIPCKKLEELGAIPRTRPTEAKK